MTVVVREVAGGVSFAVKVVPGASRDRLVGGYGDSLKVQVAAAAEGGKANARLCEVLAAVFGVAPRAVEVASGHGSPRKVVMVHGVTAATVMAGLRGLGVNTARD